MASHSRNADALEHNATRTHEYNFAPSEIVAQASLSVAIGEGRCTTGIAGFRYREHPNGADKEVTYPNFSYWVPTVHNQHLSSVTFGYSVYDSAALQTLWNVFFW